MRYITESKIEYYEAFLDDRFIMLNMCKEGIWLVDKQHPKFEEMKKTAIEIAKTFGDEKTLLELAKV